MKILFAVVESSPLLKLWGLGDVMGFLPKALIKNCGGCKSGLAFTLVLIEKKYNIKFKIFLLI